MSINPDELFKVLSGDAGVVKCPFCHTDNRVPDVQTPMRCARCDGSFGFIPGEVPSAGFVSKLTANLTSVPGFSELGSVDEVKAVSVDGLARKHFALCVKFRP